MARTLTRQLTSVNSSKQAREKELAIYSSTFDFVEDRISKAEVHANLSL